MENFYIKDKKVKTIITSFTLSNEEFATKIREKFNKAGQLSSAAGMVKELMMLLAIDIGEGLIQSTDEIVIKAYEGFGTLRNSTDIWNRETALRLGQLIVSIGIMQKLENGPELFKLLFEHTGKCWNQYKNALEMKTGRKIDYKKFRIIPTHQEAGQHVIVDAVITKINDKGEYDFIDGFSLKFNGKSNKDISLKEGSWKSNVCSYYQVSGSEKIQELGRKIEEIYNVAKAEQEKKHWDTEGFVKVVSGRVNALYEKSFGFDQYDDETGEDNRTLDQMYLMEDLYSVMVERFNTFHDDVRFKDVILTVTSINPDDSVNFYQTKTSELKKSLAKWLEKGPMYIRMKKAQSYKGADGKIYWSHNPMEFVGGPAESQKVWLRQEVRSSSKIGVKIRSPFNFLKYLFEMADKKDQKSRASYEIIEKISGFIPTTSIVLKGSQYSEGLSTGKIVLGLYRPGSKYKKKIVTSSGQVKYLYKKKDGEEEPEQKKDQISERKEAFNMKTDSVEKDYKAIFQQAYNEIPEEFFSNIDAGVSSIRITEDSETFFDFLGASSNQRQNAEFGAASGTYNVSKGKIAYNIANFPEDISDIVKKRTMLHEVGHAWFFGTMRMKEKKPMRQDEFKELDKAYVKGSVKFIDQFGKIDKEMRKGIDEQLVELKGDDKKEAWIAKMSEAFIDYYAAKDEIENFAQCFAYYFVLKEALQKKCPDIYKHFNQFFKKYSD